MNRICLDGPKIDNSGQCAMARFDLIRSTQTRCAMAPSDLAQA